MKKFATKEERRSDRGNWETVLCSSKNMRGSSLDNPVLSAASVAADSHQLGCQSPKPPLEIDELSPRAHWRSELVQSGVQRAIGLASPISHDGKVFFELRRIIWALWKGVRQL